MRRFCIRIKNFCLCLYARTFYAHRQYFIVPGLTVETYAKRSFDIELKILCFGFGIRLSY